ncbi:MAG: response regulator, partial [Desulfobacteraceae bacterium]|nr:response regulator [Desulfobacteraceae bacterium]
HDFNNILSGIFGYSELAEINIENPEKAKENISQIVKGAQRATELVHQILAFSRQTEYQKQPLQFNNIVKEVLKLLRPSIPATIDIKENIISRATVLADPSQMHQVIMNLCTNAYHAMGEKGGVLTVKLSEIEILESDSLPDLKLLPGIYLKLEVKDTGCGMDKKTLEKAFDPYFTTKKEGKGTGFGLALVQAIVEEHNGYVNAYSEVDQGSIFNVYFPIVEKTDPPIEKQKKEILIMGTEKIMVVDDEEDIRMGTQELLESCGYQVSSFCNGLEAFQEFEKTPYEFDLIITDMTMPKMTGLELSTKILNIRKDMPIILSTGYYENLTKDMVHRAGIRKYIQKPVM